MVTLLAKANASITQGFHPQRRQPEEEDLAPLQSGGVAPPGLEPPPLASPQATSPPPPPPKRPGEVDRASFLQSCLSEAEAQKQTRRALDRQGALVAGAAPTVSRVLLAPPPERTPLLPSPDERFLAEQAGALEYTARDAALSRQAPRTRARPRALMGCCLRPGPGLASSPAREEPVQAAASWPRPVGSRGFRGAVLSGRLAHPTAAAHCPVACSHHGPPRAARETGSADQGSPPRLARHAPPRGARARGRAPRQRHPPSGPGPDGAWAPLVAPARAHAANQSISAAVLRCCI
jgi:hypothetical protein